MAGTIVSVVAIINGQTYQLSKGEGDTWTASATAPTETSGSNNAGQGPGVGANAAGKGYYPVTIRATDDSGNVTEVTSDDTTWAEALKLKVLEKTAPVANLTYPSQGAFIKTAKPEIRFTVTDSGSGVNGGECYVVIDSQPAVKGTASVDGTTATVTYTPSENLTDGEHTVKVYAMDYDGNKSNEASASFTIDTTPPTLNVTSPAEETTKTNQLTITVAGTTNDETSSPVTVKITGGAQDYNNVVVSGGSFSQVVQLKNNATNTLVITGMFSNAEAVMVQPSQWQGSGPWTCTLDMGHQVRTASCAMTDGMTAEEAQAYIDAGIHVAGVNGNTVTLRAMLSRPTIAIKVGVLSE